MFRSHRRTTGPRAPCVVLQVVGAEERDMDYSGFGLTPTSIFTCNSPLIAE